MRVLNTTVSPVTIQKGKLVSDLERLSPLVPHQTAMKKEYERDDMIENMISEVDPTVPPTDTRSTT